MKILLTGIDGYTGWPLALALSKKFKKAKIIGVDSLKRREWVKNIKSKSAIKISSMSARISTAKKYGYNNIFFIKGDLINKKFVFKLFKKYKFDLVIHTAAQPSAPYANYNIERCYFTHLNNNLSTLNLLWAINFFKKTKKIRLITTTTTGVYGQPNFKIPEGFVKASNKGKSEVIQFGNMGSSWYHITKSNDINNLWLANKLWKIQITDLRTSIIYGTDTEDTIKDGKLATRFDFDYFFGVVINRFCAMSVINHNLTVYGKGLLKRPFISLKDYVRSTINLISSKQKNSFEVLNQTTELLCIRDIAELVSKESKLLGFNCKINFLTNPRIEKESHRMEMENSKFLKVLKKRPDNFRFELKNILKTLARNKITIEKYKKILI